jgi:2'-hydroxyisoflavone reductase
MKLLVLGGTRFLGRHFVEAAIQAGHDVTVFARGVTPSPWTSSQLTHLVGDRDPRKGQGLAVLEGGSWDAAIDLSGYVPRCVEASAKLLETNVGQYTFISSMSVYADASRPDLDEATPVAVLADPETEDIMAHYGALKASCEGAVRAAFGERALIIRPGLIVGPHDATDRFGYWVARFLLPERLGDRPQEAVVFAPPSRPVQFIDARDLASWMLDATVERLDGTFNASSPPRMWTMGMLVDVLIAHAREAGKPVVPRWIDEAKLVEHAITPWTELPLWIPATDVESGGFMEFSSAQAVAQGLHVRPLSQTVADTAAWLAVRDQANAWKNVLSADKERALLAAA